MEINKIYCGDCLEVMKLIDDNSIDCILTDSPYGINYRQFTNSRIGNPLFHNIIGDDNLDFFEPFIMASKRILKDDSCLFLFCRFDNYPYFYEMVKKYGFHIKNCLIWEKNKGLGGLGDIMGSFFNNYEFILFATKGRRILFEDGKKRQFGLIKDDSINNSLQLVYPTQKPLNILRKLINISTKKGDLILDCFCGSGSVCLASKQCERNYIGIDINPKAVRIANKRLQQQILKV